MIENELLNFGVLGLWTMFNISTILYYRKQEQEQQNRLIDVIENNTIALTKVHEAMRSCRANGRP